MTVCARLDGDASLVNALLGRLLAVLLLAFVVGGAKVLEGDTRSFDLYLLQGAQLSRPCWWPRRSSRAPSS
ncbi:MAG: hypothetical protein ACI9I0_000123 [Rhodoferax sp.]